MPITRTVYETGALFRVLREGAPVPNYWRSLFFTQRYNSTDEWIEFGRVTRRRKLAPFVVPTAQGRPIYEAGEEVRRVKGAYLKPKDAVAPSHMLKRRVGNGELTAPGSGSNETPQARHNAIVADITLTHREAIERRWEWLAAQAILYGEVTVSGPDMPTTLVDFQRPAGHTIILGAGARWGDAGVSILSDIMEWREVVREAPFGGFTDRLTIGSSVWGVMQSDEELREQMDTQIANLRPSSINLGLLEQRPEQRAEFVGRLSGVLDLWVYSDWYEDPDTGTATQFMDPRDVLLSGPGVEGVEAFGAILDNKAGYEAVEMFPKMWEQDDPPGVWIMTQSAPLMIPTRPESTLRARVIA